MIQFVFEGSVKSMFESVVRRCTKYLKAMTLREAPAKMFMYATITHCQGKITQRALALWHLHSWHLDVPPKARNCRREIQEPKEPVLSCQSTRETIGNNSALKKLAERIYTATKKVLVLVLVISYPDRPETHTIKNGTHVKVLWVYWFWQANPYWLQVRVVSS